MSTLKEQGFYQTPAWRHTRAAVLMRDHYLCRLHISKSCTRKANTVHHIKELEQYPELALDINNLISCCYACHEETKRHDNTPMGVRVIRV